MEISPLLYIWIKSVHIIAFVSWMAGLLYLPRLFIYHCASSKNSDKSETFKIMERRLLSAIMNPAMLITFITGGLMGYSYGLPLVFEIWFLVKAGCLSIITLVHMYLAKCRKDFEMDINQRSQLYFRVVNEIPTVLMVIIVIMVVVKPF